MIRRTTGAVARVLEVEEPAASPASFTRTGIGWGALRLERETTARTASVSQATQPHAVTLYEELEKRRRRAQIRARRALSVV
jgi:hypothetical protein